MKKTLLTLTFVVVSLITHASTAFFFHVRVPDAVGDVRYFYFELSNNGDTLFTELNSKFAPGYVFSETAESRIRKGTLEFKVRYSKNGKKWKEEQIKVEVTAKEAEVHFYYAFGGDEDGKAKIAERTVYRIMRGDDKAILAWQKSEDGKDSSIHFTNKADTMVYAIGLSSRVYGEMFRRNESNLFAVEWKGVNTDNPCHNQKDLMPVNRDTSLRVSFPNFQCNELKSNTAGKYQCRVYVTKSNKPLCGVQGEGLSVCILDAQEYILQFDRK